MLNRLKNCGIRYFEKANINQLLMNISNQKINIDNSIGEAIQQNFKFLDNLTLFEIYLILHTFRESNVELGKLYIHLFSA